MIDIEFLVKQIAYMLMAISYYVSFPFNIQKDKILLIMTHDDTPEGNIRLTQDYFQKQNQNLNFKIITKDDYSFKKDILRNLIHMFLKTPYHIATSQMIFLDNVFLPISKIKLKKETKLIQLWHGTGTLKKFALDSESGWIKKSLKNVSKKTTHYIVASDWMKDIYESAFGIDGNQIYNIGCPRTDLFFDNEKLKKMQNSFYIEYPELKNKKLILYAPTFRDNELNANIHLDINQLLKKLPDNYIIGLRLHPHINSKLNQKLLLSKRVYDFSNYSYLNTLLVNTYTLISDYSSIIFEYSLLNKPMFFFAYDLDEFTHNSRGFYENYESIVPGPVVKNTEELIPLILNPKSVDFTFFKKKYLENCDGNSVKRLYALLND